MKRPKFEIILYIIISDLWNYQKYHVLFACEGTLAIDVSHLQSEDWLTKVRSLLSPAFSRTLIHIKHLWRNKPISQISVRAVCWCALKQFYHTLPITHFLTNKTTITIGSLKIEIGFVVMYIPWGYNAYTLLTTGARTQVEIFLCFCLNS